MSHQSPSSSSPQLLSPAYVAVWVSTTFFFASLYLVTPILPRYVLDIGGSESQVGWAVGLFTVSALLARLFVGREVDRRGRRGFLFAGSAVFVVANLLYPAAQTITALYLVRLFHGLGIAAYSTATTTLVADLAPQARRGEALSLFGLANNLALAVAPAVGDFLQYSYGARAVFGLAALLAAVGLAAVFGLREPPIRTQTLPRQGFISPGAVFPSVALLAGTTIYGITIAYLPLLMEQRALGRPGLYFTMLAVGLVAARLVGGKLSDRVGRRAIIAPGAVMITLAMLLIRLAGSQPVVLAAALIHGMGFGALYPGILAYTVDRAPPHERGKAMAMITATFDVGVAVGTAGLGWLAAFSLGDVFSAGIGIGILGLVVFEFGIRRRL